MLTLSLSPCLNPTSLNLVLFRHWTTPTSLPPRLRSPLVKARFKMSSDSLPPLPDNRTVLGCGGVGLDFLAAVASFPKPDDKIRSTSLKVQGGGNAGNALTCAARLGLNPRIISKVADDPQGKGIVEEFEADGVDTSFLVVSEEGNSPFTYIIVDNQTKTRTCIHTPGEPPMTPDELSQTALLSALDGARIVYLDGRLPETAMIVAQEASRKDIPILIDAERQRELLDDLLKLANYAVCSVKFPQVWTGAPSVPSALVSMLLRLPNLRFVIVTLGEDGCIMVERSLTESPQLEEVDVDSLLEQLKQKKDDSATLPTCISSLETKLTATGIGTLSGRLLVGTAEKVPPSELVDTTGAGDAFIGAILYAICANMPPEKMLPFAAQVAAVGCRALGARTGLPHRTDPRLASFL
ncbi:Ribokinase, Carbohydrate kinase PfkB, Ribokinase-like protein [Melia azedarach]|uniref:Ribokinase, Carbohydrate kinase PfkB, Ribokinase-like protein n=2 Tax=Melia azedarach TaxID=155640 RepID=A0ACC1YYS5_MELAZ|nr:Ribokinase, Carbohydrate kinase PfkB, Ribokinase-like protein [Melia azedarach]KAJ4728354.1 Ribokinase, Carbohydrate kinase PfkB, Ribokinase-like protein [Melia azedarach]